jgi:hypothetical protein
MDFIGGSSVYFSPPLPFVPPGGRRSGVDSERPGASAAHVPYGALLKFSHQLGQRRGARGHGWRLR